MRLKIKFKSDTVIVLPIDYNYYIQSMIYKNISDEQFADFLHNKGYSYETRTFKMFTFSRLEGNSRLNKVTKEISFIDKEMTLIISSANDKMIEYLSCSFMLNDTCYLKGNNLKIDSVEILKEAITDNVIEVTTLTPVVVYSTLASRQTVYYSPEDYCFNNRIRENIIRKFSAFTGTPIEHLKDIDFQINVKKGRKIIKKVVKYKNFIIIGYLSTFVLRGESNILQFAYDCGIGDKSSLGFGLLQIQKGDCNDWIA